MLSIIIPAYNEEKRIVKTLGGIRDFLKDKDYEIIVVNDGSKDGTVKVVEELHNGRIQIINNPGNKGKGYSVKNGMLHAKGDLLLFSDADLSTPIEELEKLLPFVKEGYGVIIGSRAMKESDIKIHQPFYRELMGKFFNKIVRVLAVGGIKDTQCGFKLFTREAADKIFKLQKLDGFSFDVELLYLAKKLGFKIKEVPIVWINDEETKVSSIKDSAKMFFDLFKIRWLHARKNKI
jgi:dolichyl-phosphate beta-glucosyltransferase